MAITRIKRHYGFTNTGSKVAVLVVQLPGADKDNALITEYEALPPKYRDTVVEELDTGAQNHANLAEYFDTRRFPSGERILQALHNHGHIKKYPINKITMNVTDTTTMPLIDIVKEFPGNEEMVSETHISTEDEKLVESVVNSNVIDMDNNILDTGPWYDNITVTEQMSEDDLAVALLDQSKQMMSKAKELKAKAEEMNPDLKSKRGRPPKADKKS